jgi:hypothetical protein
MKHIYTFLFLLSFGITFGQTLLNENFDYGASTGNLTTLTTNWLNFSGSGVGADGIGYVTTSLSMADYPSSGIGGAITIDPNAEDADRTFTAVTSGTVYMSALFSASAVSGGANGTYFLTMRQANNYHSLIYTKTDGAGGMVFGVRETSSDAAGTIFGTTSFALNTTYLLVLKYDFTAGRVSLFVLPAIALSEPGTAETTTASGTDATSLTGVAFRQATGSPTATIDGVRVATSWSGIMEASTTWTGTTDTDWATTGNWNNGLPTSTINTFVFDVANAPIISGTTNAAVKNLTITEPDGLTINSGGTLIVSGTSSGNVTYKRNLGTTNFYLVSSPVAGQAYNDAYVTANDIAPGILIPTQRGIATYTTATNQWAYLQAAGSGTFGNGTGYSVKRASIGDLSFTGTINTDNVSVAVSNAGTGFNLIGNPYTAHINSATFLTDNTANLVSQTIWVWDQATSNYITHITFPEFILAPAQGFFVRSNNGTNLNIAESYQAATGGTFQKSSTAEVKLLMNDGTANRFAKMYYLDNATKGFDNGYDGETFGGVANTVDVFTNLLENNEGKKYQVQSLPNSDFENMVIPVGVKAAAGKEITFSVEALNIPSGINVYLEDKTTNTVTLLSEANATYKVTLAGALDGIGRFYLHTKASSVLSTETIALGNVSIYTTDASTLRVAGLSQGKASVKVFSLLGKQVFETSFNATGVKDMQLPKLASGIYVVQLATENGTLNKKITLE